MYKSLFGGVIRKMRMEQNLTQERLATLSNLERTFISMLERGIKQPSLQTISDLAGAFNLKSYELLHLLEQEIHAANCPSNEGFDCCEEQRRLKALEAEHEKMRIDEIANSIPVVFFARTPMPEYEGTFVSRNIRQLIGYDRENFVGPSTFWQSRIHPEDRPKVLERLGKMNTNEMLNHAYRFRTAGDQWICIREELRLIAGESGTPKEILGTMTGEICGS